MLYTQTHTEHIRATPMSAASQEVECFNTSVLQSSWTDSQDWEGVSNTLSPSEHLQVQSENQTHRQTDRQTNGHTNRHTNRHTHTLLPPHHSVQNYEQHTSSFRAGLSTTKPHHHQPSQISHQYHPLHEPDKDSLLLCNMIMMIYL